MIERTVSINGNPLAAPAETEVALVDFKPEHFINRELSWLEFNARVLEEAEDPTTPLLERVKFLSIFSSNLDEFFMVRVAGLREQAFGDGAPEDFAPDGLTPIAQLERIAARTQELVARQYRCWNQSIAPALAEQGIQIVKHHELTAEQQAELDDFFRQRAFRILTPMAIDPSHPSPRFQNRGLYVAAMLELDRQHGLGPKRMFAVVQVPQVLPRLVQLSSPQGYRFITLADAVQARLPELFGGFSVLCSTTFRITRDCDFDLLEQESDDMLRLIEERLRARARGDAVRIEVSADADEELLQTVVDSEDLRLPTRPSSYNEIYRIDGPLDLTGLMVLYKLPGLAHLRDAPFTPRMHVGGGQRFDMFAAIRQRDILLHHPFDSFAPVVDFVSRAATDPQVLAIKQTLYRTGPDSPITKSLIQAAENGKHVTALVELQARFDEEFNVTWARQMERAGVHVVFGFMNMKTHCKASLAVRQEGDILRRYVHLSTGNYNPTTATVYTDLGLFTVNEDFAEDVSALFNLLTGYSQGHKWRKLIVAPQDLQRRTIELIEEQAQRAREGKPSRIFGKFNALVDHRVIQALYKASQAGVPIDLVVRGICCLRPGLPGISETVRVRSVVDRFLEHSRIFVFGPADEAKVFLASADWMPRNFYRRMELMFPVETPELREYLLGDVAPCYLRDNVKARVLASDGGYSRLSPAAGESAHRCQVEMMQFFPRRQKPLEPARSTAPGDGDPGDGDSSGGRPKRKRRVSRA
ncbi:MAG: polyphosphate kinase 1 [Planctomycetia bacterium]|nr:polyphosphate kinase 1 [Planctomycetia bacterium]